MGILHDVKCPVCGGMGAQIRNKPPHYTTKTLACKHCDAELDSGQGDMIREALKERTSDPQGIYLSRKPTRRVN